MVSPSLGGGYIISFGSKRYLNKTQTVPYGVGNIVVFQVTVMGRKVPQNVERVAAPIIV